MTLMLPWKISRTICKMQILLDTHMVIWYFEDSPNLAPKILAEILNPRNKIYVSITSFWEIAIKIGLNKLTLDFPFEKLAEKLSNHQIQLLSINVDDTVTYLNLPLLHRDPFDRMLIAQAINHSLKLASADEQFGLYPVDLLTV